VLDTISYTGVLERRKAHSLLLFQESAKEPFVKEGLVIHTLRPYLAISNHTSFAFLYIPISPFSLKSAMFSKSCDFVKTALAIWPRHHHKATKGDSREP